MLACLRADLLGHECLSGSGLIWWLEQLFELLVCEESELLLLLQVSLGLPTLEDLQAEHFVLDRTRANQTVHDHFALLANAVHPVDGLCVHGGIPGRVDQDDAIGARDREASTTHLNAQADAEVSGVRLLEFGDLQVSVLSLNGPVHSQELEAEDAQHARLDEIQHARALGEDQTSVASLLELGQQHREHPQLARQQRRTLYGTWHECLQPGQHVLALRGRLGCLLLQ
mmetsp:Transcript_104213/g.270028  ORF Transcript_104213/g.270028 Transcript_104213/m.270028 type:complete len:228 (-) Transcript_104213:2672-3355(-)